MKVKIYKILKKTKVEGPGNRYCIWFQGCSRHCKGCWAQASWDFDGGKEYQTEEILKEILSMSSEIEGVTFLGGEPFEQPEALYWLSCEVKKYGLSVVCFSGNKIDYLKKTYPQILSNIDLLIDGEYIESEQDFSRPWTGSKNQGYHFLSDRYNEKIFKDYKNKIEINIQKNGLIFINGMGDFKKFSKNLKMFVRH